MTKAVIFDFDGTLCDTGIGVKKSAKYALDAFNIDAPDWEELGFFIGPPLLVTFQEKFNQSAADAEKLVKKYRERYTNIGLYESEFYPGIPALLQRLKNDGMLLGIASSKPINYVEELLIKAGLRDYFDYVGAVSFSADCEKKQSIIDRTLANLDVTPQQAIMVGDRFYDMDGARETGVVGVGVLWGFGTKFELIESGAKYILDKVEDVEAVALGMYERCESVQKVFSGNVIDVHIDDIALANDKRAKRECVDHPGGVAVLCLDENEEAYLVRQFRYPYKEMIYEIPAGKLEKDENPYDAAVRELREECGAECDKLVSLGEIYPTPGYTNEIIRLYFAHNPVFIGQDLDEDEFLQVCKMKLSTLEAKIMTGEIKDAKTIIAVLKYKELGNKQ